MSDRPTVVVTAELPAIAVEILSRSCDVITHPDEPPRSEDVVATLLSEADGAIVVLTDPITRRVLQSSHTLRVLGTYSVGTDNVDLAAAKELGITITHTPAVLTDATADLTITLLLAVTRRIFEASEFLHRGQWTGFRATLLLGPSLQGKTLGIVGLGRIGQAVARRALAFGMRVIAHTRSAREIDGVEIVPLDELLARADFVSLHAPLTSETDRLLDGASIASMKHGSYVINTSRGRLIDESALADAIESGHLGGAALDVFEREPEIERRLLAMPNVVLLPHIGSATIEARTEMARAVATDIANVLRGGAALYAVE